MEPKIGFGVDVGGSGIKAAAVDLSTGELVYERKKLATPKPATPDAVAATIAQLVAECGWTGKDIGVTLPSVIQNQVAHTAANIDPTWVETDCAALFERHLPGRTVHVLNDADAAGLAEVKFGNPAARDGSVLMLTFGTGIGSALLSDGVLYPNSELGHLVIDGTEAEHFASSRIRTVENLDFPEWAARVSHVLTVLEKLLWPRVIIVGGGISREHEQWIPLLTNKTPVVPAQLRNTAGIVGAAFAAEQGLLP
ncbi:polyphosphate--glucose phosphotransferase [Corynebacterium ulceribovis]|uniref:polyphosphate--glucose phosphotransferase n=1 Tax=Corynebacterium ulceribovis TaxID=487732 RepID=UPI000381C713|nr:ROK family protein [Corynebacterium ulceribovis]